MKQKEAPYPSDPEAVNDLKERLARLSPEKRALLQAMLMKEQKKRPAVETIPRREDSGPAPLSFGQNRLWFLDRMAPGNAFFNLPLLLRMEGALKIDALEKALNAIVGRHEMLRTTFHEAEEGPVQVVADRFALELPTADYTGMPEDVAMAAVRREFAAMAKQPFDLTRLPLIRVKLLRIPGRGRNPALPGGDHVLILVQHHIVTDGWSMGVFMQELRTFYEGFSTGEHAIPPELPIQYGDFAHWQRERLSGDALSSQIDYWKARLSDAPRALSLPFDRPRPAQQTFRGSSLDFRIDLDKGAETTEALHRLARETESTLFMVLLAAFSLLLARYSGQTDLVVGTPVANRNPRETEPLLGFFLNTLALRIVMKADWTFTALVRTAGTAGTAGSVKETVVEAFDHADLPFERLVEALQPERSLNRHPLFQVVFVLQNAPLGELALPGLTIRPLEHERFTSQLDLSLSMIDLGDGLRGMFEYDVDLFDADTISRMAANFKTLLKAVVADPNRPIFEYPVVSEFEKRRILTEFNPPRRAAPFPRDITIHGRFEEQARKTPENVAVVFTAPGRDRQLTYAELNRAANRTAWFLRESLDIRPDERIAVLLERSEILMAAMLGIMKAGGAYVPIDPDYPEARVRYILEDSGSRAVITHADRVPRLQAWETDIHIITLAELETGPEAVTGGVRKLKLSPAIRTDDPEPGAKPTDLAYVIYTSGSTGKPKGVMIEHRAFINMALSQIDRLGVTERDRVLQFFSVAFDGAMFDIFAALFTGGGLVCVSNEEAREPDALLKVLREKGVTIAALPPSFIRVIGFENLRCLRALISAGERAISDEGRFADADHHYWNFYGPTEASVMVADFPIPPGYPPEKNIPIGTPIRNTRLVILHPESLDLQPIGAPGELCIAGEGLARGYLNRSELTEERFIPLPLLDGERVYRSGDLARRLPDGKIELMGRIDDQVKIRGFRIELEEIEKRLVAHPDVTDAVVISREIEGEGEFQGPVLIAYVVGSEAMNVEALRRHLGEFLPGYMLPSRFIRLDKLPLTPNRKVDKNALPDPESDAVPENRIGTGVAYVPPTTPEEAAITAAWTELLRPPGRIGIHDNYFALGGDSIRTVQVVSRLAREGWRLSVRDIFRHPTPAELGPKLVTIDPAAEGSAKVRTSEGSAKVRTSEGSAKVRTSEGSAKVRTSEGSAKVRTFAAEEAPLTPVQRWFFQEVTRSRHHFNQCVLLKGKPRFDPDALESALAAVWAHHDTLRMAFLEEDGVVIQHYAETAAPPALDVWDWRGIDEDCVPVEETATHCQEGLNLSTGALMKAALFRLQGEDRLLIVIHHLVVDIFSFRVLMDDLDIAYDRALAGKKVALPPQSASFRAWSEGVAAYAGSERLSMERTFWREMIAHPALEVAPVVISRDGNLQATNRDAETAIRRMSETETEALLSAAPQGRIEVLLLAGLGMALAPRNLRERGLTEGIIMMAGHGRESELIGVDVGRTVGWFSTMYPLRLTLFETGQTAPNVEAARRALDAIPDKGFGYGVLRYLHNDPLLSAQPWPQIIFNYLGRIDSGSGRGTGVGSAPKWFEISLDIPGPMRDPLQRRVHAVEINAMVLDGRLTIAAIYDGVRFEEGVIDSFLAGYCAALERLGA